MANTGLFDVALPESISVAPLKTARPDARLLLPPPLPRTPALRPTGLEHYAAHSPSLAKPLIITHIFFHLLGFFPYLTPPLEEAQFVTGRLTLQQEIELVD